METRKRLAHVGKPILLLVLVVAVVGAVLISTQTLKKRLNSRSIPVTADNAALVEVSYDILKCIKDSDYAALSRITHPVSGLLFSPYATILETGAKTFTPAQVSAFAADKTEYVWGVYDGSAEPINLTPRDYFAEFVFDCDFTRAGVVGVNRTVRTGNALENLTEIRPGVRYIEFHIPDDGDATNWRSLRLGFEEHNGFLMLTVILHSENTV